MKKLIIFIFTLISLNLFSQEVSVTLRSQDWAWFVGKYGAGQDSATRSKVRAIRTAIMVANPQSWATEVTISNVPIHMVAFLYNAYATAPFGEIWAMGNTVNERTYIATQLKAIANAELQQQLTIIDNSIVSLFIFNRTTGKEILLDN